MRFLCRIDIHKWSDWKDYSQSDSLLGPIVYQIRRCSCCNQVQVQRVMP
jgi:hypothetical protein